MMYSKVAVLWTVYRKNLFYTRRPSSVTGPGFSGFGVFEFFLRFL